MRYHVRVVEFHAAKVEAPLISVQDGKEHPQPKQQNFAVLRRSKGGGLMTIPVGDSVLAVGQKLRLVTRGARVFLENR